MRGNLISGAGYFFRGLSMLPERGIRAFIILPLTANIVLFGLLGSLALDAIQSLIATTESALPDWLSFVTWLLVPILWLAGGLLTGYTSTLLVLLLTSPFHALLAEKVEEQVTGKAVPALEGFGAALLQVPRGIAREISKILYYIPMVLLVLVASFLPGINALSPLLWFLLGAWMMSLQFIDCPMDNHRFSFKDVREASAERRLSSIGFGAVVAFVSGIPFLNLIVVPAAVIGATLLWCEELNPRH